MEANTVLLFDPSTSNVLGVFGDKIHVESHGHYESPTQENDFECVLTIPKKKYLRIWNMWLEGKKDYCERYNYYCGVMGYTIAEDFTEIDNITLNKFNPQANNDNEDTWFYIEVPTRAFLVNKFEDHCDFEHG
jgi:hypothetical protein